MKRYSFVTHNGVASMAALLIRELIRERVVPAWCTHIAVDGDGGVFAYEGKPDFDPEAVLVEEVDENGEVARASLGGWVPAEGARVRRIPSRYRFDECAFPEALIARFEEVRS